MSTVGIELIQSQSVKDDRQTTTVSISVAEGGRVSENPAPEKVVDRPQPEASRPSGETPDPLSFEDMKEVARKLNETNRRLDVSLRFDVDEDSGRIIISVTDKETNELIRQIPPEEVLEIAKRIHERVGVLFNTTA